MGLLSPDLSQPSSFSSPSSSFVYSSVLSLNHHFLEDVLLGGNSHDVVQLQGDQSGPAQALIKSCFEDFLLYGDSVDGVQIRGGQSGQDSRGGSPQPFIPSDIDSGDDLNLEDVLLVGDSDEDVQLQGGQSGHTAHGKSPQLQASTTHNIYFLGCFHVFHQLFLYKTVQHEALGESNLQLLRLQSDHVSDALYVYIQCTPTYQVIADSLYPGK